MNSLTNDYGEVSLTFSAGPLPRGLTLEAPPHGVAETLSASPLPHGLRWALPHGYRFGTAVDATDRSEEPHLVPNPHPDSPNSRACIPCPRCDMPVMRSSPLTLTNPGTHGRLEGGGVSLALAASDADSATMAGAGLRLVDRQSPYAHADQRPSHSRKKWPG